MIWAIFFRVPIRWLPVDALVIAMTACWMSSGLVHWLQNENRHWPRVWLTVSTWVNSILGAAVVVGFALAAFGLVGIYGPVGQGGALIFALILLLLIPYAVVLPCVMGRLLRARV